MPLCVTWRRELPLTRHPFKIPRGSLGTTFAVHGRRHYSASIARTLSAREQARHPDMLQRLRITRYTHRRRRTGLIAYQHSIIRQEAARLTPELPESLLQAAGNTLRQQLVDTRGMYTRGIRCRRQR